MARSTPVEALTLPSGTNAQPLEVKAGDVLVGTYTKTRDYDGRDYLCRVLEVLPNADPAALVQHTLQVRFVYDPDLSDVSIAECLSVIHVRKNGDWYDDTYKMAAVFRMATPEETEEYRIIDGKIAARNRRLDGLFAETERLFPGVGDPLRARFEIGSHRWLARDREEAYSDWLAWILERQDDPGRILPLFGLDAQPVPDQQWTVEREKVTPYGRLDLVISDQLLGVLCIEVKTESDPGEGQLERYLEWLEAKNPRLGLVLLARDSPGVLPRGCRFCSWEHVARNLRIWASEWLRAQSKNRTFDAVMTLAFCGAIERNLLSLGGGVLNALRTAKYLNQVLYDGQAKTAIR